MKHHLSCICGSPGRQHNNPWRAQSRPERASAFSLLEMLTVLAIVGIMTALTGPAIRSMMGAGDINRSVESLSGTLELARTYAMTHHTYVRVAFSKLAASGSRITPSIGVLVISSADGTLDSDTASDMADSSKWPEVSKPLVLENIDIYDSLNSTSPQTGQDALPSASDIGQFSRKIGGIASAPFSSFVQFSHDGEARVIKGESARFIKLGMDRPQPQNGKNPFVLRISGINGTINVLRSEALSPP